MHKISNFTGQARHGWERMTPTFGMSRPHTDMTSHTLRRPHGAPPMTPPTGIDPTVNMSFNVPFSSTLAGPDIDDVIHASPGALQRWSFPEGTPEGTPVYNLPVHASNVESLRRLCRQITESSNGRVEAVVTSSEPKSVSSLQRRPQGLVTNVCITGDGETVRKMRAKILNETPILLRCATVDVDIHLIMDGSTKGVRSSVLEHLDTLAAYTGTDIFLLSPKFRDSDSSVVSSYGYASDNGLDHRFRVSIYGDMESAEHAKTRVLIMIDQILKRHVDAMRLELTMHTLVCGRTRKNIKLIEAATGTAIYFPPPFPRIFGYTPPGAHRRSEDEVYITGDTQEQIARAKQKLRELVMGVKIYVKDVIVNSNKIDNILLDRLDKVRKVMEMNGSYVLFPQLGSQRGLVRIQGTEVLHVERTVREIMALAGQFYSASWWIIMPDPSQGGFRAPSAADIRTMLSDICTNSGAEVSFDNLTFTINGSDDAVKSAMMVVNQIPFVKRSQYQMRVKIELANEHKEFVSGKKNGKINKIMGQSNVQIIFDGFNEYNFYIDVCGNQYESTKNGLDLVEQEMPASISFHVPDQYHKRIIGIGGQHIQRIMKKYSVFVKFSNAMDRGGMGKEDDDIKVDNVICRTPARNAQSLDLVKQEIMDMVEKVVSARPCRPSPLKVGLLIAIQDAEYVSERVVINRLYHRELLARMTEIDELEKKWNCKIEFPSTELASDVVTISGPEYQVPQAVDALLGMVPESHELLFQSSQELRDFFRSPEFREDVCCKLKEQYEVDTSVDANPESPISETGSASSTFAPEDRVVLGYTRNNAGGLKDAIDFLISRLVAHGLDATTVKGAIPRPKSDSFEESLPFFDSKLLQHAPTPIVTDSPTRPNFPDETSERGSIFERLRKPGSISSFSSFIGRKNHSASPGSFFKHASSNASKASLVSMESRDSGYRNPWNDSGVNLPEDDLPVLGSSHSHSSSTNGWPARFDTKFPFGTAPGDMTPKHDPRASFDSGRPSTSNSTSGYPAPIGPPR
ncbi:KH domain protein [Aspergillus novofumigatus IBT 16806]|uniref:KH domain protein n=1 Tax=Aspergillus novofumigatus (strain IBT 16806) TaxID=1392255 RepID=A0A2I1CNF0_ASPN1|nr:KH domain protein [Aspergillus novofumigatus IBT 16806]PKX99158.1 KH domain protein [Aspergillus novofumigatus IBT 16806]